MFSCSMFLKNCNTIPLRVFFKIHKFFVDFSEYTTTLVEFKDCSQFSMIFLRSCILSISNIVPYSYISCNELEGFVLVFH